MSKNITKVKLQVDVVNNESKEICSKCEGSCCKQYQESAILLNSITLEMR
mgnify:CR=1 FL=1